MINVTAAIIIKDGKVFIAKRSSTSSLPNKWEFPGGKVEVGETPEECLERELHEEFYINVTVGNFIAESVYHYERKSIRLIAFRVYTDQEIKTLNAHDDIRWVPIKNLLDYDLAPADVPIAKEVQKRDW
jgi:8-oxo-dGTP diphosphatase